MKEPHEEYSQRLRKLERLEEAQQQQQQEGNNNHPDAATGGLQKFNTNGDKITELDDEENTTPSAGGGTSGGGGSGGNSLKGSNTKALFSAGDIPVKSPARRLGGLNNNGSNKEDDDDWGDEELCEDLLPM